MKRSTTISPEIPNRELPRPIEAVKEVLRHPVTAFERKLPWLVGVMALASSVAVINELTHVEARPPVPHLELPRTPSINRP